MSSRNRSLTNASAGPTCRYVSRITRVSAAAVSSVSAVLRVSPGMARKIGMRSPVSPGVSLSFARMPSTRPPTEAALSWLTPCRLSCFWYSVQYRPIE